MGNQSSKSHNYGVEQLLGRLLPNERDALLASWSDFQKSSANSTDTVPVDAVKTHYAHLSLELRQRLARYFLRHSVGDDGESKKSHSSPSGTISKVAFLKSACLLARGDNEEKISAVYALGELDSGGNLKSLLRELVDAGLSAYAKRGGLPSSNSVGRSETDVNRLVEYLILSPHELGYDGAFDGDLEDKQKEEQARQTWLRKCSGDGGGHITQDEFTEWWNKSSDFNRLLCTLTEEVFFIAATPKPTGDVIGLQRSREKAYAAPEVATAPGTRAHLLTLPDAWLLHGLLPADARASWQLVYSSAAGKSWHAFSTAITENGATLILVKEAGDDGHVFGGFSNIDWKPKPHFYGTNENFLLSLVPQVKIHRATSYNSNYQYFTFGQATLKNGLQFGGQEGYPGIWIDADFEHGSSRPCTTYGTSHRLSETEDFDIGEVEAWCLRQPERDEDAEAAKAAKRSVMDTHADAVHLFEAQGRRMYSKEVRDADLGLDEDD